MSNGKKIPWWIIIVCFFSGALAPIGIVLLFIKIFGEAFSSGRRQGVSQHGHANTYQAPGQARQSQGWDWRQQAQNAEAQPVTNTPPTGRAQNTAASGRAQSAGASSGRVYQTPPPAAAQGGQAQAYAYSFNYNPPPPQKLTSKDKRLLNKISPNVGRGLIVTGSIFLISAAIVGSILLMVGIGGGFYYASVRYGVMGFVISMFSGALAGLPFLIPGKIRHERAVRCQTFYAMLKNRHNCDIREMAAAVPCSYSQACKDLRWMIHQGFYPGAYIDASRGVVVFSGFASVPKPEPKPQPEPVKEEAKPGVFTEVERIRSLNDDIADEYVSMRLDRLEELTFKILSYVEANPNKEERIRQFRNHYLPKTIKILESYANFERQGVHGANIRAAMKDVESIMDTLVTGFEKQLDMLFVDEALDVSTDINVLESMMGIQGLGSEDPFKLELYGE